MTTQEQLYTAIRAMLIDASLPYIDDNIFQALQSNTVLPGKEEALIILSITLRGFCVG